MHILTLLFQHIFKILKTLTGITTYDNSHRSLILKRISSIIEKTRMFDDF